MKMPPFQDDQDYAIVITYAPAVMKWIQDQVEQDSYESVRSELLHITDLLHTEVMDRDHVTKVEYHKQYLFTMTLHGPKDVIGVGVDNGVIEYKAYIATVLVAKNPLLVSYDDAVESVTFRELWLVPDEDGKIHRWIEPERAH
jgi:hypothetical protein